MNAIGIGTKLWRYDENVRKYTKPAGGGFGNKTGERIVRLSCRLGAPGEVFGVSARTVAAWRAHATRGTYAKQK